MDCNALHYHRKKILSFRVDDLSFSVKHVDPKVVVNRQLPTVRLAQEVFQEELGLPFCAGQSHRARLLHMVTEYRAQLGNDAGACERLARRLGVNYNPG